MLQIYRKTSSPRSAGLKKCCMRRILMCVLSLCWQKVETQDFASHKKVSTIYIDGNMLIEIEFVARETQDFASLQADAVVMK